jgi:hypothetical protein
VIVAIRQDSSGPDATAERLVHACAFRQAAGNEPQRVYSNCQPANVRARVANARRASSSTAADHRDRIPRAATHIGAVAAATGTHACRRQRQCHRLCQSVLRRNAGPHRRSRRPALARLSTSIPAPGPGMCRHLASGASPRGGIQSTALSKLSSPNLYACGPTMRYFLVSLSDIPNGCGPTDPTRLPAPRTNGGGPGLALAATLALGVRASGLACNTATRWAPATPPPIPTAVRRECDGNEWASYR